MSDEEINVDESNSDDAADDQSKSDDMRGLLGWITLIVFFILFAALAFWFLRSDDDDASTAPATDEELAAQVADAFAGAGVGPDVQFIVVDGRVTVTGSVADSAGRDAVLLALGSVTELAGVDENLEVLADRTTPTESEDAAPTTTTEAAPSGDDELNAAIKLELEALFVEYGVDGEVDFDAGIWTIRGLARDEATKAAISGAARRVEGVNRTRIQILVVGDVGSPATDGSTVLAVNLGRAVLRGAAPSEEAAAALIGAAQKVFGAGNVKDELAIEAGAEGRVVIDGDVATLRREQLATELAAIAAPLGLVIDDQANYVNLTPAESALQDDLDAAVAEVVINFGSGSSALSASEAAKLEPIIEILVGAADVLVAVEGHTDDVGDAAANQALSQARAEAVVDYLVEQGVEPSLLRAVGNGESQPIADNSTGEGRAQNRRTEFRVVV